MEFLNIFLDEMNENLNKAIDLLKEYLETRNPLIIKKLHRIYHTLKGSAGLVGMHNFGKFMHELESAFKEKLNDVLDEKFVARVIKISNELMNKRSDLTEKEISYYKNILLNEELIEGTMAYLNQENISIEEMEKFYSILLKAENDILNNRVNSALKNIKNLRIQLQKTIENEQFVLLKDIIKSFENLIFQEAIFNNKKVNFIIDVENIKIEKEDANLIKNILIHIVKNSIAHGIEDPEYRKKVGKDEKGNLKIKSYIKNNMIYLEVSDDGYGLNIEAIKNKAKQLGYDSVNPLDVIFYPGFSIKEKVDQSSGRGVGLDAVKAFAEFKGGDVKVETEKGKGTKFIVKFKAKATSKKVLVLNRDNNIFSISSDDIIKLINKPEVIDNKINYNNQLFEIIDFGKNNINFCVICKNNVAVIYDEIKGYFETRIVPSEDKRFLGFAKSIFTYPIPIISIKNIPKNNNIKGRKKKRVLILDDSIVSRYVISKLIKSSGYDIIESSCGKEALDKKDYDAAIVDVELPDISGYEVVKFIKEKNPDIPVIILSTKSDPEEIKKGLSYGANAYVLKGDKIEKIIILLKKFLGDDNN
ncbi:ATP-binding response regulator [Marinitoga sp. 1155]|uniref:ATP-binding response regulator n=1 Tax=Marinitoga sp. 1155 TaxID=1428448 RepID=UPI0006412078|nr:response regulator [Marinitoga sp. 1155]KLO22360.1 chemotaxis protein CheA [Marinitoga sp. 1155]